MEHARNFNHARGSFRGGNQGPSKKARYRGRLQSFWGSLVRLNAGRVIDAWDSMELVLFCDERQGWFELCSY